MRISLSDAAKKYHKTTFFKIQNHFDSVVIHYMLSVVIHYMFSILIHYMFAT